MARDDRQLHVVHVAVDEAGHEQRRARQLLDRRPGRQALAHLARRARVDDPAVVDDDDRVGLVTPRRLDAVDERIAGAGEHRAAKRVHARCRVEIPLR